ncbi:hypothetical protein [Nitrosomonas supralitoralis]|uniref:Uncharacterized protein n=1 Tax=Nitrosomonas supralitoralis TaxID=2116706 RepID=A0A2P7NZT7_9PROT|nr:hypothetical protein [Nitrosomonas supralitoralis]PSJ18956.1 hypothetical protein C7H79_00545 [Nitrosomonas supralitoralis]
MKQSVSTQLDPQQTRPSPTVSGSTPQNARDNRPETIAQLQLIHAIQASSPLITQHKLAESMHNSPQMVAQRA